MEDKLIEIERCSNCKKDITGEFRAVNSITKDILCLKCWWNKRKKGNK